jgi:hypothetical protein
MTIGIELSKKETELLKKHLTEIERKQPEALTRAERNNLSLKFKTSVIAPARKENAARRAARRATKAAAHAADLKWTASRPPRRSTTR